MNYEIGLDLLKQLLPDMYSSEFNVFEGRLRENLGREKLYGGNEVTRSERAQIIDQLNKLAVDNMGVSFVDICNIKNSNKQDIQIVLSALESQKISDEDIKAIVAAVHEKQKQLIKNKQVFSNDQKVVSLLEDPKLGLKNKLKLSLPIIPTLLSYEGEIELGGAINLKDVWVALIRKIKG